jgi:hypothetical protein
MTNKNRYSNRSKISEKKIREIVRYFALDLDALQIAKITCLNRNTINRYLKAIRERIAEYCQQQSPFSGEVEVDESYFGARRVKGQRGRGSYGKLSFSESSKETVASIQKSSQTAQSLLYKGLYEVVLTLRPLSIRMVGEVLTAL